MRAICVFRKLGYLPQIFQSNSNAEPKQSHKVNEISQTVNHDQNQSHKVNEISQMIIDDSMNKHNNDMKINIINIKQLVSSNFVKLQP